MKESNYAEAAKTYDNNSVNVDVGVNENDWKDVGDFNDDELIAFFY